MLFWRIEKTQRMARSETSGTGKFSAGPEWYHSPCRVCHFGRREVLVWGEDARAVQWHWLCFAGAHPVGTAEPGHGCTGRVSCLLAQQQPGLHHTHSNGQPVFRQADPLLSFVSRSAQTLFMRSASFVQQSFRVNIKPFSLPLCFNSLITNVSVVLGSS